MERRLAVVVLRSHAVVRAVAPSRHVSGQQVSRAEKQNNRAAPCCPSPCVRARLAGGSLALSATPKKANPARRGAHPSAPGQLPTVSPAAGSPGGAAPRTCLPACKSGGLLLSRARTLCRPGMACPARCQHRQPGCGRQARNRKGTGWRMRAASLSARAKVPRPPAPRRRKPRSRRRAARFAPASASATTPLPRLRARALFAPIQSGRFGVRPRFVSRFARAPARRIFLHPHEHAPPPPHRQLQLQPHTACGGGGRPRQIPRRPCGGAKRHSPPAQVLRFRAVAPILARIRATLRRASRLRRHVPVADVEAGPPGLGRELHRTLPPGPLSLSAAVRATIPP